MSLPKPLVIYACPWDFFIDLARCQEFEDVRQNVNDMNIEYKEFFYIVGDKCSLLLSLNSTLQRTGLWQWHVCVDDDCSWRRGRS